MSKLDGWTAIALALSIIAAILSGIALLFVVGIFEADHTVSRGFEARTREYLLHNPEVIIEAVQRIEERQQARAANESQLAVRARWEEIFNDAASPVGGNPQGDVTVAQFFDYNCPYCRKAAPVLAQAEEADRGLRVVYKEFPILGPGSRFAARAALASHKQGKYLPFHAAMMASSGPITESAALQIAQGVGLDVERLKQDMEDPEVAKAIERNLKLADELRITGTPSFVVADDVVRGLVDVATLQKLIAKSREQPKQAN